MTKPTKPTAVDGPTLDDAANPEVFSTKTFDWVEYTPLAVDFMAESNDYVEGLTAEVDADATAVEISRAQVVLLEGQASDHADAAAESETQAALFAVAAGAASPIDLASSNIGDLLQVIDDDAGGKELAMSAQRLENSASFTGTTPSLDIAADQYHHGTLTGNTTFTFDVSGFGTISGNAIFFVLEITQDSTIRTITFPASVQWRNGLAPDTPATNATSLYTFMSRDGGATWRASYVGTGFA